MTGEKPIGWWVKRLDQLLEQVLDCALVGDGLTRRHWQVLHALAAGGLTESALRDALAPFARPDGVPAVVAELAARGWVTRPRGGRLQLTATGRVAHERLGAQIGRLRRQVTDGFTDEEYDHTVAALARMAANAERALAEAEG